MPRPTFSNRATPKRCLDPTNLLRHRRGGLVQAPRGLADRPCLRHDQRVVKGGDEGRVHVPLDVKYNLTIAAAVVTGRNRPGGAKVGA